MATTTIGGMTLGTAANLTGAAKLEMEDSAGASVYYTAVTLRTKMFAGGTGYTAADPLVAGSAALSVGLVVGVDPGGADITRVGGAITASTGLRSATGTVSATTATFTSVYALPGAGVYVIHAWIVALGTTAYQGTVTFISDGTSVSTLNKAVGANLDFQYTAGQFQVKQTSGSTQTVTYVVVRA